MGHDGITSGTSAAPDDRYVVISADGHAGGDIRDYRPYLESQWLDEFDVWAAAYEIPFEDLDGDLGAAATGTPTAASPTSRPTARSPR